MHLVHGVYTILFMVGVLSLGTGLGMLAAKKIEEHRRTKRLKALKQVFKEIGVEGNYSFKDKGLDAWNSSRKVSKKFFGVNRKLSGLKKKSKKKVKKHK